MLSGPAGSCTILGFERVVGNPPFFVRLAREEKSYPDLIALAPPGFEFPHEPPAAAAPRSPSPPTWDYPPPAAATTSIRWPDKPGPSPAQPWQPALAASPPTWGYVPPPGEAPLGPRWPADPRPAPSPWEHPAPSPHAWEYPGASAGAAGGGAQWAADARPWPPVDNARPVLVQSRDYC